jgi:DNA-binding response OmpR family regulator
MKVCTRATAERPRSSRETESRPGPTRSLSILVVDDDRDSADGIAMLLRHWNHSVRVAYEGRRALEIFSVLRPELVLLDITLPGMNGYELAARMRSARHRALLVAVTGSADRRRALAAGFAEYFPKPVDLDALRDWISGMERGRAAARPWP